ncbi:MAG: hypothetical protein F4213_13310 [Boseongicola sp. SB0677_bin_26]|nr:hypothetical protein [Boseongicola sp. SB0677_bin_26]
MAHYNVVVPVEGGDGKIRYRRVGALFENVNRESGETFYKLKLDFPVGATEFLAFPPRPDNAGNASGGPAT